MAIRSSPTSCSSRSPLIAVDHERRPKPAASSRSTCGRSSSPPSRAWACGRRREYRYLLIAPGRGVLQGGIKPVSVWLSTEYVRASPAGTGAAKFGGNYAASLLAQSEAAAHGCDQVVWLDAIERRYVEEMGGMNLFFVFGSGGSARLVTPELSGSLLPGITRDSLLQLAGDAGFAVEERKIDVEEWRKGWHPGEMTEAFACGTAAVITRCAGEVPARLGHQPSARRPEPAKVRGPADPHRNPAPRHLLPTPTAG